MFFTLRRLICCHDVFHALLFIVLTFVYIISGTQYFESVFFYVINIMIYFWLHDKTYFWRHAHHLYRPDIFVHHFGNKILWKRVFDVIDIMIYFYFMVNFWRHDKPLVIMPCFWWTFWGHGNLLTSWYVFDIMTNFLTFWQMFWCHFRVLTS